MVCDFVKMFSTTAERTIHGFSPLANASLLFNFPTTNFGSSPYPLFPYSCSFQFVCLFPVCLCHRLQIFAHTNYCGIPPTTQSSRIFIRRAPYAFDDVKGIIGWMLFVVRWYWQCINKFFSITTSSHSLLSGFFSDLLGNI